MKTEIFISLLVMVCTVLMMAWRLIREFNNQQLTRKEQRLIMEVLKDAMQYPIITSGEGRAEVVKTILRKLEV